jgi:hypothetical protein
MNIVTLAIIGATALFLGLLFARKTALQYLEWIEAEQPRDKFSYRVMGLFYDWGASRLKADETLNKPARVFVLMIVETLLAVVLFSLPFFFHKYIVLFIIAVILLGCAFFIGRISRIKPDGEKLAAAFVLPLQIYAAIRLFISLIIFIAIAIYEFFKSAIAHSKSSKAPEKQELPAIDDVEEQKEK